MSDYQNAKLIILSILEISKDAIHIHVGLIVFFAAVVLWRIVIETTGVGVTLSPEMMPYGCYK